MLNLTKRACDLKEWFSQLFMSQQHQEGFLKSRLLCPTPGVTDSVGLGGA